MSTKNNKNVGRNLPHIFYFFLTMFFLTFKLENLENTNMRVVLFDFFCAGIVLVLSGKPKHVNPYCNEIDQITNGHDVKNPETPTWTMV